MTSAPSGMTARLALALSVLVPMAPSATPLAAKPAPAPAPRCGWIANPTPGNWWITDRDGEWLIGMQGGYQARGLDNMPDLSEHDWVTTNGSYGYGCACLSGGFDRAKMRVSRIDRLRQRPIAACRADHKLKRPQP